MNLTNEWDIPLPLQVWLAHDEYDHIQDEKYISATQLLNPLKQLILRPRVNDNFITTDISSFVPAVMGTSIHDGIEKAWLYSDYRKTLEFLGFNKSVADKIVINPEKVEDGQIPVYIEQRSIKEIDGYKIGGKFDYIGDGILHDFKSTSAYTWVYGGMDEKYRLQGSIYRWLNQDKVTSDFVRICFIFTDWQNALALTNKDYPQHKIMYKDYPLLSIPETEKWIKEKLALITKYWDAKEEDIPECNDEELWRSETKYKYYANPTASKATKVFDSLAEANKFCLEKGKGIVRTVKGEVKRCKLCPAAPICKQRRQYFND